jgi:PAS domain S-box-containing protein
MATGRLADRLRETLALFEQRGVPLTTTEVANSLDVGRRSTYERLETLVEEGRLETKKVGANARVWWRSAKEEGGEPPDRAAGTDSLAESVLDDAGVGIVVLNEQFEVAWINGATEQYFGLGRGSVLGRDSRTLVEERLAPVVENPDGFAETVLATYEDNSHAERFECRVEGGDGHGPRWLEHSSYPIESGVFAGGRVELYYDITECKRSKQGESTERHEFESLVNAVEEYAIFTLDADGHVRTWNPGAERIKGYEADEILGEHVSTFYTEADREAGVPERNLAVAAEEGSVETEGWRICADGSRFWANVTLTAIRDDDGEIDGYAKVTRDMSDQRERERDLRRERNLSTSQSILG